jgi:hypothetical protein
VTENSAKLLLQETNISRQALKRPFKVLLLSPEDVSAVQSPSCSIVDTAAGEGFFVWEQGARAALDLLLS